MGGRGLCVVGVGVDKASFGSGVVIRLAIRLGLASCDKASDNPSDKASFRLCRSRWLLLQYFRWCCLFPVAGGGRVVPQ